MNIPVVRWPRNYHTFYAKVRNASDKILNGTLVAIDPSSGGTSLPGFAIFRAGQIECSGEIEFQRGTSIYQRLQILYDRINKLVPEPPDVMAIEELRGTNFSHIYLKWAVGVAIAAGRAPITLETPLNVWKALAKVTPGYFKGNSQDAEMIGFSVIALAEAFAATGKQHGPQG